MNIQNQADFTLLFPRKRNADAMLAAAKEHLGARETYIHLDQTKLYDALMTNAALWNTMRGTEGRIYAVIDIPAVANFRVGWRDVVDILQTDLFQSDIHFGCIVDKEVAQTRKLKEGVKGERFDHVTTSEFDTDFFDAEGPGRVIHEIRKRLPAARILETTDGKLKSDLPNFFSDMKCKRWKWD